MKNGIASTAAIVARNQQDNMVVRHSRDDDKTHIQHLRNKWMEPMHTLIELEYVS